MKDFEQLGLFYLGREIDAASKTRSDAPLLYESSDLVTHAVIAGMTGSGKTGLGIDLIEEAAIDGIPVIAIDPKGDLGNLLLTFPKLAAADFAPWVDTDEARRARQSADAFAAAEAAKWSKGLAEWGQDGARIDRLRSAVEVALYTPGSSSGRPLSIVKSFAAPDPEIVNDADLLQDRVSTAATSVLTLAGVEAKPMRGREHTLIATLFSDSWRAGRDLDLPALITQIQTPPIQKVGVVDLESFFPSKERFALAMQLNQLLASPSFGAWLEGEPLDVDRLLYNANGGPRVSIISIAHLDDQERMFFVSLLLNEIVGWMRSQRGTSSLRTLIYFDEIFGFLPPVANPPSKKPLLTILKQARAFGVGLVVATQNPVDLDYKALANAGTWMLGRLQTERDKARVLDGLEGAATGASLDRAHIGQILSGLGKRQFLLHNVHEKEPVVFETRWTLSYLRGPLGRDEIKRLSQGSNKGATEGRISPKPARSDEVARAGVGGLTAPVLDPAIQQLFVPGATSYVPMLLGVARIAYSDTKLGLDDSKTVAVVTPITDGAVAVDWERAELADFTVDYLLKTAPAAATFAAVPAAAAKPKNYATWEKDFLQWIAQSQSVELFRSSRAKVVSNPDESERDFRIRLQGEAREARDQAVARLRQDYASKIAREEDQVRRAEQAVQKQSEQASGAKMQAAVSVGAAILGAFMGRKVVSATNIRRATTAARGAERIGRESADVTRASENLDKEKRELTEIQQRLEEDIQALTADWDLSKEPVERVLIKPKRGGVSVQLVSLVWVPA
ncbi:MAG: ATP-binding protein [Cyanobacteria bacterium]|nr:ATP-binding protein [Cyanobacteriota bacterium]